MIRFHAVVAAVICVLGGLTFLGSCSARVWLSYWTLTVKPRGQAYAAGEVLVRLQAPIDR